MAQLVDKWPLEPNEYLDNKQYNYNEQNWQTGAPITKDKLENLEVGIRILATQMQAIINEIGSDGFEAATSNSSWIDKIRTWITGSANGSYNGTNIISRLGFIDTLDGQQNTRLTNIESINTTQSTDISSLKTRATNLENRATAIETLNIAQNERLDSVENKNTEQDGRLDNIDTVNTSQNTEITNLKTRATNIESVNTTQNTEITNLKTRATNIESVNTVQDSRLDNLESRVSANEQDILYDKKDISNFILELGENYDHESGFSESRITTLRNDIGADYDVDAKGTIKNRLDSIESLNSEQSTDIDTLKTNRTTDRQDINTARADLDDVINEIGSHDSTGFHNSNIQYLLNQSDINTNKIRMLVNELLDPDNPDSKAKDDYSDISFSRLDKTETIAESNLSKITEHTSQIGALWRAIESSGTTGSIVMFPTINEQPSDILLLNNDVNFKAGNIAFIFLTQPTLGQNNLKIQTTIESILNEFKICNSINGIELKTQFNAGTLLGMYISGFDGNNKAYVFNAPFTL